ncbi:adenosine kinase [Mangrovibacterium marinum]|uniref:Sugar/nucleoside kinase (Ribokinase family) n=1 Tax=Mangrovibacterium marinum TaxID=1639118 RepID=A0A2T5BX20_9BACT|nr:adenosine kinase [Mangrovibacterium marinum]PTN04253.1 sugar/nucleoside kinase (ribokinase family) [Mangrovibacterium marinum]
MENAQKTIVGIGNALVDVLVQLKDDHLLEQFGLPKGSMTLVDADTSQKILSATAGLESARETGGSAANTVRGIAQLGAKTAFIGKINADEMGHFFRKSFEDLQIKPHLLTGNIPSGVAATLISPDSERTFGTYLGAASEMVASELSDELFAPYDYLHIEGYLVFNHELIEGILKIAKKNGLIISLDMASFNVVEANLDFLKRLVNDYVDIVFANEEEAKAFTGKEPEEALLEIAEQCSVAVVKIGKEGSLIKAGGQQVRVAATTVNVVDTTGAGDVYASGFLYGLANGFSLANCGKLGGMLAAEVIQVVGAKIPDQAWPKLLAAVEEMKA